MAFTRFRSAPPQVVSVLLYEYSLRLQHSSEQLLCLRIPTLIINPVSKVMLGVQSIWVLVSENCEQDIGMIVSWDPPLTLFEIAPLSPHIGPDH